MQKLVSAEVGERSTARHTLIYEGEISFLLLQRYMLSLRDDTVGTGGPRRI